MGTVTQSISTLTIVSLELKVKWPLIGAFSTMKKSQ